MPSSSIYFPWCDFKRLGDLGDYVLIVRLVINHFFFNLNDDDAVIIQTLLNNSHFSSRISFSDTGDPFFFPPSDARFCDDSNTRFYGSVAMLWE